MVKPVRFSLLLSVFCLFSSFSFGAVVTQTFTVAAEADDGIATAAGLQSISDTHLAIGDNRTYSPPYQMSAMRFANINIPRSAAIISANLSIRSLDSNFRGSVKGSLRAETTDHAPDYTSRNISNAPLTAAAVNWDHKSNWSRNTWYTSPDIALLIQQVIDRPNWQTSNAAAIYYSTRTATRKQRFFGAYSTAPAQLEITYEYYRLSGTVTTTTGPPLQGVQITAGPDIEPTTTNASGYYQLNVPPGWSGTVTATPPPGWGLTEWSHGYTNITADQPNQNFTAFQPTISGYVNKADGTGLAGATVTADNNGGLTTTDADGYYQITVPYNWSGTVTANKIKWEMTPESYSFANLNSSQTDQNFSATYISTIVVKADGTGYVPTIQAAIDIAVDGDIVQVEDGTYTGDGNRDIDFLGKAITVRGNVADPNLVIIDCQGTEAEPHRGFIFISGEGPNSILAGFTITNGYGPIGLFGGRSWGGAIYCENSSPVINQCLIINNSAYYGGGIYVLKGSPDISNCTLANNAASIGGGIYDNHNVVNSAGLNVSMCVITNNDALFSGGGGYFLGAGSTIQNCILSHNSSENAGGGLLCSNGGTHGTLIKNCIINSNSSYRGGGIYASGANIESCTIIYNVATYGGGIHNETVITTAVENSVLWANLPSQLTAYAYFTVRYCNIQGGYTGSSNINLDPLFENDSFHLTQNSPCINSGNPDYTPDANELDIDGNPRVVGGRIDMGAIEFSTDKAFILMADSNVNFTALENRDDPLPQIVSFINLGLTNVNWAASADVDWLNITPATGNINYEQVENISIAPDIINLSAGEYFGQITISDPLAINSPKVVEVNLTITGPLLSISQSNYSFTAGKQTMNPLPQILTISNPGGGTLSWTITPDCNWMSIEPASGAVTTGTADVMLDIDQSKIDYGNHTCQLTVEAANATNSPQTVTVTLNVLRPEIGIVPSSVSIECDLKDPSTFTQAISISNSGYDTLNWQIDMTGACDWLSITPSSGQSTTEPNEVTLTVDTEGLEIGFYDCELTITADNASNSPRTVPVSLHVYRDGQRHVPAEYPTIQAAINAAVDGDHVIIHPGRYAFGISAIISYQGKAITVRSIDPTNPEVVASTIVNKRVYFDESEGRDSILDGLTLNGSVSCRQSSPVIRNCIINASGMGGGSAIAIYGNRDAEEGALIQNCLVSFKGGAANRAETIVVLDGRADIINTTIAYSDIINVYYLDPTGGVLIERSEVSLINSIVWGNRETNDVQIAITNNSSDFSDPLNSRVYVAYSDIEGGKENILLFADLHAGRDYRNTGIPSDPNFVDPNTLTWGPGNIDADPLFVRNPNDGGDGWFNDWETQDIDESANNDYGDLHLKSQAGHFLWEGFAMADFNLDKQVDSADFGYIANEWLMSSMGTSIILQTDMNRDWLVNMEDLSVFCDDYLQPRVFGAWVADEVTSPCIDAGDPGDTAWRNELWPHGARINMGAYGGTAQASMSDNPVGNTADLNHDGRVDLADWSLWADDWLKQKILLDSDFDRDNHVNPNDLNVFINNWLQGTGP